MTMCSGCRLYIDCSSSRAPGDEPMCIVSTTCTKIKRVPIIPYDTLSPGALLQGICIYGTPVSVVVCDKGMYIFDVNGNVYFCTRCKIYRRSEGTY